MAESPSLRMVALAPRPVLPEALDSVLRLARLPPRLFIVTVIHSYDAEDHWLLIRAPGKLHSSYGPSQLKRFNRY